MSSVASRVVRVEVQAIHAADDPTGPGVLSELHTLGIADVTAVRAARVFLLQGPDESLSTENAERIARELLTDPVTESFHLGVADAAADEKLIEVHLKPGVMDPVAASAETAISDLLGVPYAEGKPPIEVRTGRKYLLAGNPETASLELIAKRLLVNESIETGHFAPFVPEAFPVGHPYQFSLVHVPIRELTDEQLLALSRQGHLFLDLREMQAIQQYFCDQQRDPTDAELETIAQTWSEHCVHKTLKARVEYSEGSGARGQGSVGGRLTPDPRPLTPLVFNNLIKETVFRATQELISAETMPADWALSVFKDNAGVIAFDDEHAVCMKVETHNRPSAIEPYGGAATGIGGVIRDVLGTGLGAKPFANTDIFCFGLPDTPMDALPAGVIHPRRTAQRVVAGVRDYGNRMGIPTVNGAVYFDPRYTANPLVFCGTVGIMPTKFAQKGQAQPGDRIVVIGGRTGRDGIHGATFSSDVVTSTHADEFSHAVQIGNAITEKKVLDVILQARDWAENDTETGRPGDGATADPSTAPDSAVAESPSRPVAGSPRGPLFNAITDCGAGGLSSAIGEMGEKVGATVELDKVPLKYAGLSYAEIWISEAQERMVLAVPPAKVQTLLDLCASENVEATDIGEFDGTKRLTLHYQGHTVAQMDMSFLHDGIPMPVRQAVYTPPVHAEPRLSPPDDYARTLHDLLALPTIASKHWIVRQYDHEVQGGTVIKPFVGALHDGPSDAAVMKPVLSSNKAVALAVGCQPRFGDIDPYQMALNGIDEALRNITCAGGNLARTAILDNFCWPKCTDPQNLGALVRACQACYDGAKAFRTPFVSGKDSLSNEFITETGQRIQIPYTLLISAISVMDDARRAMTMDAKAAGNHLLIVGQTKRELGGSRYYQLHNAVGSHVPIVDLATAPKLMRAVSGLIHAGLVKSAHDCSEGGLAVALAEMLFAGNLGAALDLAGVPAADDAKTDDVLLFAESATRFVLEIEPAQFAEVTRALAGLPHGLIGTVTAEPTLVIKSHRGPTLMAAPVAEFKTSWLKPLDF